MNYETIEVNIKQSICFIRFCNKKNNNMINNSMINECLHILKKNDSSNPFHIVVLEGLPKIFCLGADFDEIIKKNHPIESKKLYELWYLLSCGPFISLSNICSGRVNAGGIGFIAACDIVLANHDAQFSLSELLFNLFPACVLPFLIRRIGFQRSNYMTLMTKPITAKQALEWNLVDAISNNNDLLLHKHLLRLKYLSKNSIKNYKKYINELNNILLNSKNNAISTNHKLFSDSKNLEKISYYMNTGYFPWE
ncbi:enoyl-CoA hydratase/isomerase [Candidatus Profftella armatura]|uniref:Polyketide biosynthesis enoyl-CoA hydratase, PedL-like protein n=1 Tax=Candidatus Profftella armatura TaxID=669502 RepID=S5RLP3_9PROT|nr:enoyl-CoA hydratase/isomerase [Candidatus Profftella armatura]AGS06836.1 polyketide biosynthesis enoyl-CoA hydratase, PedL-like protein [Candidatus Profftella armatura]ALC96125.1 enoyl-CoA hydratase [Candidatus Profftella armatura]